MPTRSARLPSQESMTKAPEPTLSNFRSDSRLLARFAGDASVRAERRRCMRRCTSARRRESDCVRAQQDRPGATRKCAGTPEASLHQDLDTSLSLCAAPTSARISPPLHAPVHHLLQVSGPYIAVGFVGFWTSAKVASSIRSSAPRLASSNGFPLRRARQGVHHHDTVGTYEGTGALVQQTQSRQLHPSSVHTIFVAQDWTVRLTSGWFELKKDPACPISKSAAQRRSAGAHPRRESRQRDDGV
ncbi:hypothetical protein EDB89DRAFT_818179 [Lactarius sanguifluus]|nr:hypothetical protein EDB89DRAFT_818179 [Lactarius sanguifluus]